jgi:hypothetical protein
MTFPYFEIEMGANCWLPDGLLYIIPLYSKMWGNDYGRWLQAWAVTNHVPLVWADGDDSGMLLDPIVNQLDSPILTSEMRQQWEDMWAGTQSFKDLYDAADDKLKFRFPSYLDRDICEAAENEHNVMGTSANGECVYWTQPGLSLTYECLNDGTCASGFGGTKGKYYDKDTCDKNCGDGKWQCMQNVDQHNCAGKHARTCVSNPVGACRSLEICERECYV